MHLPSPSQPTRLCLTLINLKPLVAVQHQYHTQLNESELLGFMYRQNYTCRNIELKYSVSSNNRETFNVSFVPQLFQQWLVLYCCYV